MALPADLAQAVAAAATTAGPFAADVHFLPAVGSTNDEAARLAAEGAPEGTAVIADRQTAGRGRRGRVWHSPPGAGLYLSLVFRPHASEPAAATLLTLMGGVAVAEAVRGAAGLDAAIKWPNDIVMEPRESGRPRRKLAGILAEAAVSGDQLQHVILGIGLNLRAVARPEAIAGRATSLEEELGRPYGRAAVVAAVLPAVARWRRVLRDDGLPSLLARWRELSPSSEGAPVAWESGAGTRRGVTCGIDDAGALLVDTPEGRERIVSGELSWD